MAQQESQHAGERLKYWREYGDNIPAVRRLNQGRGNGEDRRLAHHSRLTSTNRYTTCGDSIRKPLATDRLWANSFLGGVQKWEGSVYKDKITQWNPSNCSRPDKDRRVSHMAARRTNAAGTQSLVAGQQISEGKKENTQRHKLQPTFSYFYDLRGQICRWGVHLWTKERLSVTFLIFLQFKNAMTTTGATVCRCSAWTREFLLRHTDWTASHLHINAHKRT